MGKLGIDAFRYRELIDEVSIGKRLPDAVYLHAEAIEGLPGELRRLIEEARALAAVEERWNVLKLAADEPRMSFLWYPRFFEDGFPALVSTTVVDLQTGRVTSRAYRDDNPPVLHRKEALLPIGHGAIAEAAALTKAAEDVGLFDNPSQIGQRQAWDARLERLGFRVDGHRLVQCSHRDPGVGTVQRHRTALTRYVLSSPMQALWRHGFLDGGHAVFDYGCGRGDDLRALQARELDAHGWDPYFAPEFPKREADVVNLGFVLNVIEDVAERRDALLGAWQLARRLLVVGVLIGGRSAYERCRLFRDGVLTTRGTFQKYFTPAELREYLETHLGREPIALAPGIAFVFRDDVEEQAFLARRAARRLPSVALPKVSAVDRPPREPRPRVQRPRPPSKWEAYAELADAFWGRCLELGRLPEGDEFDRSAELRAALGKAATVLRALAARRGEAAFAAARKAREDDLMVFLALGLFERRRSLGALPESVRRDTRAFFGSFQNAQAAAQALLFSAGRVEVVHEACSTAARQGLGFLDGTHSLQLHSSLAGDLPPVLRVYLGCAARLYGDVETADVVKIHIQSGKVSLMMYDDFEERPLPELIERVKINLRRQQIDFFEYGTPDMPSQPMYLKSRYIRPGFPHYEEQVAFDEQLTGLGTVDLSGFGPSLGELTSRLMTAGVTVDGFSLVPIDGRANAAARSNG